MGSQKTAWSLLFLRFSLFQPRSRPPFFSRPPWRPLPPWTCAPSRRVSQGTQPRGDRAALFGRAHWFFSCVVHQKRRPPPRIARPSIAERQSCIGAPKRQPREKADLPFSLPLFFPPIRRACPHPAPRPALRPGRRRRGGRGVPRTGPGRVHAGRGGPAAARGGLAAARRHAAPAAGRGAPGELEREGWLLFCVRMLIFMESGEQSPKNHRSINSPVPPSISPSPTFPPSIL